MENGKKVIIIGILVIAIVIGVIVLNNNSKKSDLKVEDHVDLEDEYYKDKEVYEKDGDIIIEGENGTQTIISEKTEGETDLKEADKETQAKYELTNVKVELVGNMTKVSGTVKSNASGTHDLSILTKFTKDDGKLAGSVNAKVESIKKGESKNFSVSLMGNYTSYKHTTVVEFTN